MENQAVGYTHTPYYEGYIEREEFKNYIKINSLGMREVEIVEKDSNEYRILVLGDSYTFGFGVAQDEVYTKIVESKLNDVGERTVKVYNGGVSGYGTADQLAFLKLISDKIDPDLIVIQFLSVNDFLENRYPARGNVEVKNGMLRAKQLNGDAKESLPITKRMSLWIKANLHSGKYLSERAGFLAMKWGILGNIDEFWGENFSSEDEAITSEIIGEIKTFSELIGSELVFLYVTGQGQVISPSQNELRSEKFIASVMQTKNIEWINSLRKMRESEARNELYYPLDGHWTAAGHEFVAKIIKEKLQQKIISD